MARAFHLSCMGPLDRGSVDKSSLTAALRSIARDPAAIEKVLAATPNRPTRLNVGDASLKAARALDAALLKMGIMSQVFWCDTDNPERVQVYVNQRVGNRREREIPAADRIEAAPVARRKKGRGRRKDDSES